MTPMNKEALLTLICGFVSGVFFSITAQAGGGMLIIFLPIMPLALCGLSLSATHCMVSGVIAVLTIGLIFDPDYIPLFVLIGAFPAYHFVRKALLWRGEEGNREWYPVLSILAEITALTTVLFMTLALSSSHSEHNELRSIIAESLSDQLNNPDPNIARLMKLIITDWSFLIFAGISWVWVLLFYFVCVLSNSLLQQMRFSLRPSLALVEGGLPVWLPLLLLVSGGLAVFGEGNDKFCGETVLSILLLPYFLSGIAFFHRRSLHWKSREFWMVLFYSSLFVFFPWMELLLVVQGIKTQMESFIKEKTAK